MGTRLRHLLLRLILASAIAGLLCLGAFAYYGPSDLQIPASAQTIVYGSSGAGRDLKAYRFGNGPNVFVVGFAIHGYEDNWNKDGEALVYTAGELMAELDRNLSTVEDYGWSIYVLPCMNPDGLSDGYTNNGPGRCTTTWIDGGGSLRSDGGIDMNRSFPHNFVAYSGSRNFNGSSPLASRESRALSQFIQNVKGTGSNLLLDTHGWMTQIISSGGANAMYNALKTQFPQNVYTGLYGGRGYFAAYAADLGYTSCLFEFPDGLYSMSSYLNSGYCSRYIAAIMDMLTIYGTYSPRRVPVLAGAESGGTVSGGGDYRPGDTVTVTATAPAGMMFRGWFDRNENLVSTDNPYTFTVPDTDQVYLMAGFREAVTVTLDREAGGSVSGGGQVGRYDQVTVTALPQENYMFRGWYDENGTLVSTDNPYTFKAAEDVKLVAGFTAGVTLRVVYDGDAPGAVTGDGVYPAGETVTLTAQASEQGILEGWYDQSGALLGRENTLTLTLRENTTVTARFVTAVTVQVIASRSGSVSGGGNCIPGVETALEAQIPEDGGFTGWYNAAGELLSTETQYTLTPRQDVSIYALFAGDVFADIPAGAWYTDYAMRGAEAGIVSGMTGVTFGAGVPFTRAMAAVMLHRMEGAEPVETRAPFTDVPENTWFTAAVDWAYAGEVVNGVSETEFAPNAKITRQDFFTMVGRYLRKKGVTPEAGALSFTDADRIAGYARDHVAGLVALGVVRGDPEGTLRPLDTLNRAEGVAVLLRIRDLLAAREPEPSESPEPSASPEPSEAPEPSASPEPSEMPEPSASPEPSEKPEVSAPVVTPALSPIPMDPGNPIPVDPPVTPPLVTK